MEKICSYKCQFSVSSLAKVWASFKAAGLSSSYMMAEQNKCKEKVPDVSDPNQNVETRYNSKLKFT